MTECIQIGLNEEIDYDLYNAETDFGTVTCQKSADCIMGAGRFIICMKEEPHKPSIAAKEDRNLKKCVIKVFAE